MVMSQHRLLTLPWIVFIVVWAVLSLTVKRTVRAPPGWRGIHLVVTFFGYVVLFATDYRLGPLDAYWTHATLAPFVIGFALTVTGITFAIWARLYIGRNWSSSITIKQDHQLIQTGPYSLVRHPIYSGIILASLGTALALRQVRGLIALPIIVAALWYKARIEERLMLEHFGPEYECYRRETKALVPFVL
jgi:protein-S-isoprenylcysteine O-methyltransferase Ste14